MEAAILIVLDVVRVVELEGFDVFVLNAELAGESFRIPLVRSGNGSGIGGDGNGVLTKHLDSRPSQIRRIGTAGVGDEDLAEAAEAIEEHLLFLR